MARGRGYAPAEVPPPSRQRPVPPLAMWTDGGSPAREIEGYSSMAATSNVEPDKLSCQRREMSREPLIRQDSDNNSDGLDTAGHYGMLMTIANKLLHAPTSEAPGAPKRARARGF